ncbi:MAG: ribosome biogenesis GTPase Der [Clostridia bacterium]|nr:ribosome biogenesis GTPase Der [Clostridia bacterium]
MSKPTVAIVGRPNVGKSTLFNLLIGERRSIVEDTPGVTRDRIYGEVEWRNRRFLLVDTGGIEPKSDDIILKQMRRQAEVALESADVIIFLVDAKAGLVADDREIASMLKKSRKPVVIAVNKADKIGEPPAELYEFYELGFDTDPIAVSSLHRLGAGDLLDAVYEYFPSEDEESFEDGRINVAVIGKPNAGKSSIVNRMVGEERSIVSDIPGTTRDAVDTLLTTDEGVFNLIDTAGIRRKSKIEDRIEHYSVLRAKTAVDRADVCLIMIDAGEGITEQDEKIAGIAHEAGKASIIVVNKWDSIEKDTHSVKAFTDRIRIALAYMPYAPIAFVSAKTGQRVTGLFEKINHVYERANFRVTTGMLNDLLSDAMTRHQPPSDKGKRLRIYYATQTSVAPPTFTFFCNDAELFHFSYQRYLENCLRETFDFEGTPIRIVVRERGDDPK